MRATDVNIGDYVLFDNDRLTDVKLIDAICFNEAYKVVGNHGRNFKLLDHNSRWYRLFESSIEMPKPFLKGRSYFIFSASIFRRRIGPSCPLAKRATDFWRQCSA